MDTFEQVADGMITYHLRSSWLAISKLYNELAKKYDGSLSMAFVLLSIDDTTGTPVTKIAPRIGMEPNSLSRLLNSLEERGAIYRTSDTIDQRKVFVFLTEQGVEYRKIALKIVLDLERELSKSLESSQLKGFFDVMKNVPEAIKNFKQTSSKKLSPESTAQNQDKA